MFKVGTLLVNRIFESSVIGIPPITCSGTPPEFAYKIGKLHAIA